MGSDVREESVEGDETATTGPDPGAAEGGENRRRISLFLAAFLAYQLITPLTYYLRDDPYDERFAWRMFSAIRLHTCETGVTETVETEAGEVTRPVQLPQVVHQAWIGTLGRNRRDVIHAFLERRCEEPDVVEVHLVNTCRADDGSALSPQDYVRDCRTGTVTEPTELIVPMGDAPGRGAGGDAEDGS